ncbi:hypothetical protein [Methylotenera versatilis]|uniref:hypothetical protein n=2 Tax=Methylotenera TaxID=359407 RepID=UPI000360CDD7|nr:hypothetical protein [Methylotenera versatilis]
MMIQQREQQALEVYFKLLTVKGFGPETFVQRTSFLNRLLPLLADKTTNGGEYRLAIETMMDTVAEADWPESLVISREYYPFWINDLKAVANFCKSTTKDQLPIEWKPVEVTLSNLWHNVDQEKFSTTDSWALKAYTKALRNENAEQTLIDTRLKLSKILLVRLRDAPDKSNKIYRTAVDATLPLFEVKKNRRLFLVVVREFFHFWAGNPDAEKYILNNNTVSML